MPVSAAPPTHSPSTQPLLRGAEHLNRVEKFVLLTFVVGVIAVDVTSLALTGPEDRILTLMSIALTLTFALYAWSPYAASAALAAVVLVSFATNFADAGLAAASIGAGLVIRLAPAVLIVVYFCALLIANAVFAIAEADRAITPANIAIYLIIAAVSGGTGFALRSGYARRARLERELVEHAEREHQAVLAERRLIAGELHDSIAHHLTIVVLHVQLLDDPNTRAASEEAIREAARKALADLRFVIALADQDKRQVRDRDRVAFPRGDLATAISEACAEFEAAGHRSVYEGESATEELPLGIQIILSRIVRESATNILRYAGQGEVRIKLAESPGWVSLEITNPLPEAPRVDPASAGTGLTRMAERVLGASGEFTSGVVGDRWRVFARFPVT